MSPGIVFHLIVEILLKVFDLQPDLLSGSDSSDCAADTHQWEKFIAHKLCSGFQCAILQRLVGSSRFFLSVRVDYST